MSLIVTLDDLSPRRFERTADGRLIHYAVKKAVVCVGAYDAEYQACLIGFVKSSGAIFMDVPFYHGDGGFLGPAAFKKLPGGQVQIVPTEDRTTASLTVKYSHPPDGRAHFSRDKGVYTRIRRQSFPLDQIGHLFSLTIFWPAGLDRFDPITRAKDRVYLRNKFIQGLPQAVTITAEWRRKQDIISCIDKRGAQTGPLSLLTSLSTGAQSQCFFLGQAEGHPLQDHVLLVSTDVQPMVAGIDTTTLIFRGALDPHEVKKMGDPVDHTGCLMYMYPAHDFESMRAKLGTIDFQPLVPTVSLPGTA